MLRMISPVPSTGLLLLVLLLISPRWASGEGAGAANSPHQVSARGWGWARESSYRRRGTEAGLLSELAHGT